MENLNAEQIIKALGYCVIGDCEPCTYRKILNCQDHMCGDALSLIKELTEESEYLKTALTACEARYESRKETSLEEVLELRLKVDELTEENERWRAEAENQSILWRQHFESIYESVKETLKADTVRKMQERLKAQAIIIKDHTGKMGTVVGVGNIDDVAREMLGDDKM